MKLLQTFIFAALFTFIKSYAVVDIIAIKIPGLFQKDGMGQYDQIINDASYQIDTKFQIIYTVPKRGFLKFENCNNCCISPANKNPDFYEYNSDQYLETSPMGVAKIYIFSNEFMINNLEKLKNLKVGARRGMPYGKNYEASGLNVELVNSIKQNIEKVKLGRIDAFIAYVPDALDAFKEMKISPFYYDINNPVAVHQDSILCKKSRETQKLVDEFNKFIYSPPSPEVQHHSTPSHH